MKCYANVNVSTLPEFLSSGFIGLTASIEPEADNQTRIYPDILVSDKPEPIDGNVSLELTIEGELPNTLEDTSFRVSGPIPIAKIARMNFFDEAQKAAFVATYQMMPDIPLDLFEIGIIAEKDFLSNGALNSQLTKLRSKKPKENASQVASTIVGVREALLIGGELIDDLDCKKIRNPNIKKICLEVISSILHASGFHSSTPKYSFVLLECYCDAISKLDTRSKIEPTMVIGALLEAVEDAHKTCSITEYEYSILYKVVDKTKKIMMGMDSHSSLSDIPELILQRAIYLSCLALDLDAFDSMRRNLELGSLVEAIATLLVASRLRLNRISSNRWRSSRDELNSLLSATSNSILAREFELLFFKNAPEPDFSTRQKIQLNGYNLADTIVPACPHLGLVISMLRTSGYSPTPTKDGAVLVNFFPSERASVEVLLEMKVGPTQANRQNVKISTRLKGTLQLLSKKSTRVKVLDILEQYMLSVVEDGPRNDLIVSRYQLIDTMDIAELNYHVELVASVKSAIELKFPSESQSAEVE